MELSSAYLRLIRYHGGLQMKKGAEITQEKHISLLKIMV